MNEQTIVGYHATSKENIELILKNGFIESKANKGHWLGKGIYLFENLYYAIEWEIIGVIKHEIDSYDEIEQKCGILIVDLDATNYNIIDFSEPQGYSIFEHLLNIIKNNYSKDKYEEILNKGYAYIIKILEQLEQQNNQKYISRFDVICAVYPKGIAKQKTTLKSNFIFCVQKQICIKNKDAIKNISELEHNEITKGVFNLVKNNRGGKND